MKTSANKYYESMQGNFSAYSHNNMLFGQIAHLQAENGQLRAQLQTKMYLIMIY